MARPIDRPLATSQTLKRLFLDRRWEALQGLARRAADIPKETGLRRVTGWGTRSSRWPSSCASRRSLIVRPANPIRLSIRLIFRSSVRR